MDRNAGLVAQRCGVTVALRKESVDRNSTLGCLKYSRRVALRKESVDRNTAAGVAATPPLVSLSARRAWIEMAMPGVIQRPTLVALRKESVDRNLGQALGTLASWVALRKESVDRNKTLTGLGALLAPSLSARRAWIEIQ